jgi:predicted nuclease of restriction endonuclease-like (RecB) superfamily
MLYERTALSRKPESVIEAQIDALREQDALSTDLVLKDSYLHGRPTIQRLRPTLHGVTRY